MWRCLLLLLALPSAACGTKVQGTPAPLIGAGVAAGSFVVLQRGPLDAVYSLVTGQDCSLLHLERRGEYCRTVEAAVEPPFCTRSLGRIDCWTEPRPFGPQNAVADTPARPPAEPARWFSLF